MVHLAETARVSVPQINMDTYARKHVNANITKCAVQQRDAYLVKPYDLFVMLLIKRSMIKK